MDEDEEEEKHMFLQPLEGPSLLKLVINQSKAPSSVCAALKCQENPDGMELNVSFQQRDFSFCRCLSEECESPDWLTKSSVGGAKKL